MFEENSREASTSQQAGSLLNRPEAFLPLFAQHLSNDFFFFTQNTDGVIQFVSGSTARMLSLESTDMVGRRIEDFLADDPQNERLREGCWRRMQVGQMANCRCVVNDGRGVMVPLKMWNVMVGQNGNPIGIVGLAMIDRQNASAGVDPDSPEVRRILELEQTLTDSERAVVDLVVDGQMNKAMARILGVAVRTIEARRARAMSKLQVRSLPELVKVWMIAKSAK